MNRETVFKDNGISGGIDWKHIRRLMITGIFAAGLVMAGDMLLGYGMHDPERSGMEGFLSMYTDLSDSRIFWSAFLGLIGIPLEALCYFAVYRMIAPGTKHYAHLYRAGILGILAFGGCGVHVPCLACVFFYKYMVKISPETAVGISVRFGSFFLLPAMILFFIFWAIHQYAHIMAFSKGMTPYPEWCWIFCPAVGMALTMLLKFLPETALRNAMTAGWISVGNLWMFGGLLALMDRAEKKAPDVRPEIMN